MLADNDFEDLAIAWYNEELNIIEILETTHNSNNNSRNINMCNISIAINSPKWYRDKEDFD